VEAVPCELFSSPNPLLTGKNTGNFVTLVDVSGDNSAQQSALTEKTCFGDQSEQGTIREVTGLGIPCYEVAMPCRRST
jgi:hypothetical protein